MSRKRRSSITVTVNGKEMGKICLNSVESSSSEVTIEFLEADIKYGVTKKRKFEQRGDTLSSVNSLCSFEKFEEIVVVTVFDYDDTLFPTRFIDSLKFAQGQWDVSSVNITEEEDEFFKRLDKLNINVLEKSILLSDRAYIVTNASLSWVRKTSKTFLPRTYKCLFEDKEIEVISARDRYLKLLNNRISWKKRTFEDLVLKVSRELEFDLEEQMLNFVSIGDGKPELEASFKLQKDGPNCCVKAVELVGGYSCEEVYFRLEQVWDRLDEFEALEESKHIRVNCNTS
eukprot:snap_masked-scaffold_22-processed-gene-2.17-mRNA-1 protein AED:1.00 eAED:1.00 QI:0/-1/0/0/-1/1/1/0/285